MSRPSEKTLKRLFAVSDNMCAFPGCMAPIVEQSGTVVGEVCHIRAQSEGGPRFDPHQTEQERQSFENLILLCAPHHKVVDERPDLYPASDLLRMKDIKSTMLGRPEQAADGVRAKRLLSAMSKIDARNNSGNVVVGSPGAIVGKTVNIKTTRSRLVIQPPAGTIGADQRATQYVRHLIGRYNDFAKEEPTRATKFNHGVISKNIEGKFGAAWQLLSIDLFSQVAAYLQERIRKTRMGKLNTSKGHKSFSSFEEFSQRGSGSASES